MTTVANAMMQRVASYDRGTRVFTPKDFLDCGSRAAVDQALSRLVKSGTLRRVGRGLYDAPRFSDILGRPADASVDAVLDAVKRRSGAKIAPTNLAAANALGLTNAVPTRTTFLSTHKIRDVSVGNRKLRFQTAGAVLAQWLDSPAAPVIQALMWVRDNKMALDDAVNTMQRTAPAGAKDILVQKFAELPGWAVSAARKVAANRASLTV